MERLNDFDEKPIYEPYDYDLYNQTTELASGGQRALAGLIDIIIASVINSLFQVSIHSDLNILIGYGLFGAAYMLVRDALPFLDGQSVGKKILKIKAVDLETGESIKNKWGSSIVRSVSLVIPIINLIDSFMVFSASKQRFGDKWAKTIVVKEENRVTF